MAISIDTLRIGKKYYLINLGDRYDFEVMEKIARYDFKLKDLYSLEYYSLSSLIQFGKGKDYDLREL